MDEILIEDLEVFAHHGVFDFEKEKGQKFLVSCHLFLSLEKAGRQDDLRLSVSYAEVADLICKEMQAQSYDLIEAAAERLCKCILNTYEQIQEVHLELKKPEAPLPQKFGSVSVKLQRKRHHAFIALGANEGDAESQIRSAVERLKYRDDTVVLAMSELIESTPYGGVEQDNFVNGALEIETYLEPFALLEELHALEKEFGRVRHVHWGPRTLDLDILFYDDLILNTEPLTIPHQDMANRDFVLNPLLEIAPWLRHPITGKSIAQMATEVKEKHVC